MTIPNTVQEQTDITALIAQLSLENRRIEILSSNTVSGKKNQFITSGSPCQPLYPGPKGILRHKVTEEVVPCSPKTARPMPKRLP